MKIAYVLGTSAGGTERHVRMLADGLARRGATVNVYGPAATWTTPTGAPRAEDEPAAGVSAGTRDGGSSGFPEGALSGVREPEGESAAGVSAGTRDGSSAGVPAGLPGGVAGDVSKAGNESAADVPAGTSDQAGVPGFTAVEIAGRPRPSRDLAAVRRLRALLARSRPDVVHAHGLRAGALAALAVGGGATRPRLVVTVHNAAPAGGPTGAVYQLLEHLVARKADQVLCVSSDLESRMRGLGAREVARALVPAPPAPPDVSAETVAALRAELGGPAGAPVILTVARLAAQKGLDALIEAVGHWRDRDPAPHLVIVGVGPLQAELTRRAEAAGVKVRFLGRRGDVPALMAAADIFVLPSVWEGQPLVVQEALRAGLPVVASRVGGIPDLTGPDAALLVPPGDPAALSAALLSVLDDPALARRLSEAAIKQAATLPSGEDAIAAALAAYGRLAARSS